MIKTETYRINLVESGNNVQFTGTYEDLKIELESIVAKSSVPCKLREIGADDKRFMVIISADFKYLVGTEKLN